MKKDAYILGSANHQRLAPSGAGGGGSSGSRYPPLPAGTITTKRTTPQSGGRRAPAMSARRTPSTAATLGNEQAVGNLTYEQRGQIREIFDSIDVTGRGFISISQLPDIQRALGHSMDNMEVWREQIDPNGTGKITYDALEAFVAVLYEDIEQQEQMMNAFRLFKPDTASPEHARITFDDLQKVAAHLGESIPADELREMINIADVSGSGSVDFDDFMRIMRKTGLF